MARYLLDHRHEPDECGVVSASFKGHDSPPRHRPALASCRSGGHAIWRAADVRAGVTYRRPFDVEEARLEQHPTRCLH